MQKNKRLEVLKSTMDLAQSAVSVLEPLKKMDSGFLANSALTLADTAIYACFLARSICVSSRSSAAIDEFDKAFTPASVSFISKAVRYPINIEEIFNDRTQYYDSVMTKDSSIMAISEAFQRIIEKDIHERSFVPAGKLGPILLTELFDSMACADEVIEFTKAFLYSVRFPIQRAKNALAALDEPSSEPRPVKGPTVKHSPAPKKNDHKESTSSKLVMFLLATIVVLLACILYVSLTKPAENSQAASSTVSSTTDTQPPSYAPVTPPHTGTILRMPLEERVAPLRIHTSGSGYYYYVLSKVGTNTVYMSFFGKAGETVDVDVPVGTYDLYYTYGETWYGTAHLFGEKAFYGKCDRTMSFTSDADGYSGFELTLYAVQNGNMDTEKIKQSDFPT